MDTFNLSAPPPMNIPPPNLSNPGQLPNLSVPPPGMGPGQFPQRFDNRNNFNNRNFFKPFQSFGPRGPLGMMTLEDFDGKRLRKSVMRKTVDYNSSIIKAIEVNILIYFVDCKIKVKLIVWSVVILLFYLYRIVFGKEILEIEERYNQM